MHVFDFYSERIAPVVLGARRCVIDMFMWLRWLHKKKQIYIYIYIYIHGEREAQTCIHVLQLEVCFFCLVRGQVLSISTDHIARNISHLAATRRQPEAVSKS